MKKYVSFLAVALLFCVGAPKSVLAVNEDILGHWKTLRYLVPVNPIHTALLPNGKVLFVAGSEYASQNTTPYGAAVLDMATGLFSMKTLDRDLFCNAMSFFPDGRVLIVGGTKTYHPWMGAVAEVVGN